MIQQGDWIFDLQVGAPNEVAAECMWVKVKDCFIPFAHFFSACCLSVKWACVVL